MLTRLATVVGRVLLYTAIVMFCLAALTSIVVILAGDFGGTEGRILLSGISIAAYSLAGLIATARFDRKPAWFAPVGLGAAGSGLVLMLISIWSEFDDGFLTRLTLSLMVVVIALAHANLLQADPKRYDPAVALLVPTLIASAILTTMIVWPILSGAELDSGLYWKSLAIIAVLLVLGTLVVPIARKIAGGGELRELPDAAPPAPFWLRTTGETLEIYYRGRAFQVLAEQVDGDQPGFVAHTWSGTGERRRQVNLDFQPYDANDRHTALGMAVQDLTRAVDSDLI